MGVSPRTRALTCQGKIRPRVKQHDKRDLITALESASADGVVFSSYLIGQGSCFIKEGARSNLHETQCCGRVQKNAELYFLTLVPSSAKPPHAAEHHQLLLTVAGFAGEDPLHQARASTTDESDFGIH